MKRISCILFCLFVLYQQGYSQAIGTWEALLSYYKTIKVAEANNYVYAVAKGAKTSNNDKEEGGGALFSYGKEDNSIKFYSRQDGISDQQITHIRYNAEINTLLIVYANGNLDLMDDKGFYNIPHLQNSSSVKDKTINDIFFYKEYAYLPGNFGIMVVNMKKKEITDTYKLDKAISSVCIKGNDLYAVNSKGVVMRGTLGDNLLDSNNWKTYPVAISDKDTIRQITLFQNVLCFRIQDKGIYYQKEDGTVNTIIADKAIKSMKQENERLMPLTTDKVYICSSLTVRDVVNTGTINDISSLKDNNTFWIAADNKSLKGIKKNNNNQYDVFFSDTITSHNGPKRNLNAFMTVDRQKLFVVGGGRWSNRNNYYGTFSMYNNKLWFNFDENKIAQQGGSTFGDATCVTVDPRDADHYFVSTWGEGVFEFKSDQIVERHSKHNSPLQASWNNDSHFVRTEGVCFDKHNNLWMTNSGATNGGIKVMKQDRTWLTFGTELNGIGLIDKVLITSKDKIWVNVPRTGDSEKEVGIYVLDYNKTLDDPSDDTDRYYTTFTNIADKKNIPTNSFYCMAEDKSGSIFIGTGNGIIICPQSIVNNAPKSESILASRIVRTAEDGTLGYFLDGEQINAIAVDGGNRKWIGTQSSGLFLVNEDASETIENFTTDNSPLLSNTIQNIAIDPVSGKVYIGTDKGIISYQGDATEGSESYSDVYAFPNPVRPEYDDHVTIAGLMEDSNVKITDLSGNILYQGKSNGGQLTWNCRNRSGKRVATGVYLVFAATPESKESVVTKIMIVK